MSQKIIPNLWFNHNAAEAVEYYTSIFPNSKIVKTSNYPDDPDKLPDFQKEFAGKPLSVEFELDGQKFVAINAGPEFTPNAAISFMVNFDPSRDDKAREHLDELWEKLLDGGEVLMPLDKYPYSEHYGWVKDRYGFTWQLILADLEGWPRPLIIPTLMFGGDAQNRAEEAINYYLSVFKDTEKGEMAYYEEELGPAKKGSLMFGDFKIADQWFAAMDSAVEQDFTFNEAVSLLVDSKDQEEIDYYWGKLSTKPEAEQCGWCKDQFGVSWQVCPANFDEQMKSPHAWDIMMNQKKIVLSEYDK